MFKSVTLTIFFVALSITNSIAATWSGKVIGISDGDTLTVLRDKEQAKIRLYRIDTPEDGQWYTRTLKQLPPGSRVFVCIPVFGYVGAAEVTESVKSIKDFNVQVDEPEHCHETEKPFHT